MSGHSKWATIKHKKAALDSKRGKIFTRLIKEIMIAARNGGDPDSNARLRTAITAAKAVSMPADNIKRAVMRGTGELEGGQIDEITYEGYGPGGAAVIVQVATDNRNRTVSEVRHAFSKNGGNMGEVGSVSWMFERKSQILIEEDNTNEDQLMSIALDAGAEDIRNDGQWEVISAPENHDAVLQAIGKAGIAVMESSIAMVPKNLIKLEGKNAAAMLRLNDALEDHDDVQNVYSNFDIDDSELEALQKIMRVLGIDCGTERTGYGVIESDGRRHRVVSAGTMRTSAKEPLAERLRVIAAALRAVIARDVPEAAAVEEVFHAVNAKSALKLAHVRGVAMLAVAEAGLSCAEYSPLKIKQCVVGYGRAEKSQVQFMMLSLLGEGVPQSEPDACDALAVAICHATMNPAARESSHGRPAA